MEQNRKKGYTCLLYTSDGETTSTPTLSYDQYQRLEDFLKKKNNPALLPIPVSYTHLRKSFGIGIFSYHKRFRKSGRLYYFYSLISIYAIFDPNL